MLAVTMDTTQQSLILEAVKMYLQTIEMSYSDHHTDALYGAEVSLTQDN